MRLKSCLEPLQIVALNGNYIKAARWHLAQFQQVVLCGKHDSPLFCKRHTGQSPAMLRASPFAHLDKYQCAVGVSHDQIYFSAASSGRPIIAGDQSQTLALQMAQAWAGDYGDRLRLVAGDGPADLGRTCGAVRARPGPCGLQRFAAALPGYGGGVVTVVRPINDANASCDYEVFCLQLE